MADDVFPLVGRGADNQHIPKPWGVAYPAASWSEACIREETMSIEEIELSQKEEETEVYLVHWFIGEEEREDKIFFRYDSEGLIEEVKVL